MKICSFTTMKTSFTLQAVVYFSVYFSLSYSSPWHFQQQLWGLLGLHEEQVQEQMSLANICLKMKLSYSLSCFEDETRGFISWKFLNVLVHAATSISLTLIIFLN